MGKKVSIVLPVYNGEKNISEAIGSVLRQTYQDFELIIVNDCSTDGTQKIIENYALKDARIKVINNKVNLKLPQSLNVGFSYAEGEYYTWTSDDNLYKCDAIAKMVEVLDNNPAIAMVYADYFCIDSDGNQVGIVNLSEPQGLLSGNVIGACFLYTRDIAKKVGNYDVNLFLAEDYDYWIRILEVGTILHIKETLYYYRKHTGSLTETKKEQIGIQTYRMLEKNFLFMATCCKTKEQRYAFYDQMLFRVKDFPDMHAKARRALTKLDKGYLCYNYKRLILGKTRRALRRCGKIFIDFFYRTM